MNIAKDWQDVHDLKIPSKDKPKSEQTIYMKYSLLILLISLSYYSCKDPAKGTSSFEDSNEITEKSIKVNDSTAYLIHYHNGKIYDSMLVVNGKKNGWCFTFSEQGNLAYKIYYENGKRNGWGYMFVRGETFRKLFFYNGKFFGDNYKYYLDNRKQVKVYHCYDFNENNRRVKIYDSMGNVVKNDGLIIGQYEVISGFKYKIGEIVHLGFVVCTAPNEKVKTFIVEDNKRTEYPFQDNFMVFQKKYDREGHHIIYAIGTSIDTVTNTCLTDTQKVVFDIIDN